jgi:hypothetical protein
MTADQTPPSPEPGPDAGIDDIQAEIEHTRQGTGRDHRGLVDQGRRQRSGQEESG